MNLPQNIQEQMPCIEMGPGGMFTLVVVELERLFYHPKGLKIALDRRGCVDFRGGS